MTRIELRYWPGFSEDLRSWRLQISTAGRMEVFEDDRRVHRAKLSEDELARARRALEAADVSRLSLVMEDVARQEVVDDAPTHRITIDERDRRADLTWNGCSGRALADVASFRELWNVLAALAAPHLNTENGLRL